MREEIRDFSWIGRENKQFTLRFKQKVEKVNFIGRVLCFIGLHKFEPIEIKAYKAVEGIVSHDFACTRCFKWRGFSSHHWDYDVYKTKVRIAEEDERRDI